MYVLTIQFKQEVNRPDLTIGPFNTWQDAIDAERHSTRYVKDERHILRSIVTVMLSPEEVKNARADLIKLLESHDWYYHFSDDHSKWQSGVAQWREITKYDGIVLDFDQLVDQYRPKQERS